MLLVRQVVRSQPRILTHDTSGANTTILYVSDRKEVHVRQKTAWRISEVQIRRSAPAPESLLRNPTPADERATIFTSVIRRLESR